MPPRVKPTVSDFEDHCPASFSLRSSSAERPGSGSPKERCGQRWMFQFLARVAIEQRRDNLGAQHHAAGGTLLCRAP